MTAKEACDDIIKYADELSKHSHDDLYCRMQMWEKVIRKALAVGQKLTTNSAMVPCCGYCDGNACLVNTTMICKDKPCLVSAQHQ